MSIDRRQFLFVSGVAAAAAPVMAISRGVLGIEPIEPGYRTCSVEPQRCGLEWVRGAVPTPAGVIEVVWRGASGKLILPSGITARLASGRVVTGLGSFLSPSKLRPDRQIISSV
jgi:hypothetical protein